MGPNWTRGRGRRPLALSYSLSLSLFPSLLLPKGKGFLLGLGCPSRTPYSWRTPRGPASLPPSFIYVGKGHPKDTPKFLLAVCGAPSTVTHLGHIIIVLRRSPALVTSSSPSPRRRAYRTPPRPQLDQEFEGRHRAERVHIAEVPYVWYLDRLDREDVQLHQPHY